MNRLLGRWLIHLECQVLFFQKKKKKMFQSVAIIVISTVRIKMILRFFVTFAPKHMPSKYSQLYTVMVQKLITKIFFLLELFKKCVLELIISKFVYSTLGTLSLNNNE